MVSSPLYLQLKIFLTAQSLLSSPVFVTSSSPSCPLSVILQPPLSARQTNLSPAIGGITLSVFEALPPKAALLMKGGCCVLAGPRRLEGARSPVLSPTWGSNYPSDGPLRAALPAGQSNSHSVDFTFRPWPGPHR